MKQLNIIARIVPRSDFWDAALNAISAIVDQTRAEPGCLEFRINQNAAEGVIYIYEEWCDENAFEAHHAKNYTRNVFEAYQLWLDQDPEIIRLEPVN